jgi:hypothetical protein
MQLRNWVKQLSDDPQQAFPGHGQTKPDWRSRGSKQDGKMLMPQAAEPPRYS